MGKNAKRRREQRDAQAKARRLRSEFQDGFDAAMEAQLEAFRAKFGRDRAGSLEEYASIGFGHGVADARHRRRLGSLDNVALAVT